MHRKQPRLCTRESIPTIALHSNTGRHHFRQHFLVHLVYSFILDPRLKTHQNVNSEFSTCWSAHSL